MGDTEARASRRCLGNWDLVSRGLAPHSGSFCHPALSFPGPPLPSERDGETGKVILGGPSFAPVLVPRVHFLSDCSSAVETPAYSRRKQGLDSDVTPPGHTATAWQCHVDCGEVGQRQEKSPGGQQRCQGPPSPPVRGRWRLLKGCSPVTKKGPRGADDTG